ncbi:phenylacetic acid degradation bifunctional protein PaaZ [Rhodophyticola sp.]|jgi:oxepin-CoA hydrolase/3-oxo-5,6-dehydrosuberyl-CoA semialdehyde dehydrogenase|uniref:phenylacetic acid degradation bifunctional protein PaaZ n=1 Tax=Rhodophyticola sp. TaxID=2680032 RepID=UPI003D2DCC82
MIELQSFAAGKWVAPDGSARQMFSAVTGDMIARGGAALDTEAMIRHAVAVGGPALRAMDFHARARMLKALAQHIDSRKEELYALNPLTGATRADGWIDIDGGIGTMFVYASKGRREMPEGHIHIDGETEQLSRNGTFLGQHVAVPLRGVAVHINAFNFPVWGMLEKLAPALLAGVPCIVKPATATSYLTVACVRIMLSSGLLPDGALQLIIGGTGDLLDRLGPQDVVSFTGSADTALMLRSNPHLLKRGTRFIAEQDSLNCSVLGPDVTPDAPEFDLFIKEAAREMTTKAGQKCTAIRRIIVPQAQLDAVADALSARLSGTRIGDPALETTRMGALAGASQKQDVITNLRRIAEEAERICGDPDLMQVDGADARAGAFLPPTLYRCSDPDSARNVHEIEAFGPVSTVMPYRDLDHACDLANRGGGSLVASVITHDPQVAREVVLRSGAWHGRIYINDRDSMGEATGHGSPLPHMIHGGPGRAGGGEELGGIRGVLHYMQRVAVQGSPDMLTAVTGQWVPGSAEKSPRAHPFQLTFDEIEIGHTINTARRQVSLEDIEHFAAFTRDTFYAHMDEAAAAANPFFPGRVAHGYLLLSFAAGLFVQPDPGPVLANTGLNSLSFQKPVSPGDSLWVRLTARRKTRRTDTYGEVRWHATLYNQDDEQTAAYELLTMMSYSR